MIERLSAILNETAQRPEAERSAPPAVCVIELSDPVAIDVVVTRVDRLIRSGDVLGRVAPATIAVVSCSLAPGDAGTVMERIRGAVAMPMEIGGETVSMSCEVGVCFADQHLRTELDADALLLAAADVLRCAEDDLRHRAERARP